MQFITDLFIVVAVTDYQQTNRLLDYQWFIINSFKWFRKCVKASFMFVIICLDIYENPRRKNFMNPSCPKHPKIINRSKK